MRPSILIILLVFLICGCSSIPFRHSDYLSFDGVDPKALRSDFAGKLPVEFELLNSAVFRYWHLRFSSLGITRINTDKKELSVAAFNYLGVALFDLTLDKDKIECRYVFPQFTKYEGFPAAVLSDVQKIYCGRVPSSSAQVKKGKRGIIFRDTLGDNVTEYVFYGEGRYLAEKNYYEKGKLAWSVFYYGYIFKDGKVYPKGIAFKHRRYGYDLVVQLKEIR